MLFSRLTRVEMCCCPAPTAINTSCLSDSHGLAQTRTSFNLVTNTTIGGKVFRVEPHCDEIKHQVLTPVTCDGIQPRLVFGKCQPNQMRTVVVMGKRVVGCNCRDHEIRRMQIRCGRHSLGVCQLRCIV